MHLSEKAYRQLKGMVLSGQFHPDKPVSERTLASRLSVSRVPVREAIKELELEGLLIVVPRTGIFVRKLTTDEVRELYEVRQAVEGMAAFLCASSDRRGEMQVPRKRLERLASPRILDHTAVQTESVAFHRTLFELCGNAQLVSLYRMLEPKIDLNLRFSALHAPERIRQALLEHIDIAHAIEAGDPHMAEQITRSHLEHGKAARLAILDQLSSAAQGAEPDSAELRKRHLWEPEACPSGSEHVSP